VATGRAIATGTDPRGGPQPETGRAPVWSAGGGLRNMASWGGGVPVATPDASGSCGRGFVGLVVRAAAVGAECRLRSAGFKVALRLGASSTSLSDP
jgi:hypothetical protein